MDAYIINLCSCYHWYNSCFHFSFIINSSFLSIKREWKHQEDDEDSVTIMTAIWLKWAKIITHNGNIVYQFKGAHSRGISFAAAQVVTIWATLGYGYTGPFPDF